MKKDIWFIDEDSRHRRIFHRVMKKVLSVKTGFQHVEILDTYQFGRMVILDNRIQSAEADEYIYHEALVHPAMISHPHPREILILGGGEGATLREVLKHPTVEKTVMIDIDREFVNLCRKYLRNWHKGSFSDHRVQVIYDDAFEYLEKTESRYDVIIADISDPDEKGPAASVYTKKFYMKISESLRHNGIFVTHATAVRYTPSENIAKKIYKTITGIFREADIYYEYIPSYGTLWSFVTGSQKYKPGNITRCLTERRLKNRGLKNLLFYDAETHQRLFSLPKDMKAFRLS